MSFLTVPICLRCASTFDLFDYGATSITDGRSLICSSCETDEIVELQFGVITPVSQWPVERPWNRKENKFE